MSSKILVPTVATCTYRHPCLGPVHIKVVATAQAIRARWNGNELQITIPPRLPASEMDRFLATYTQRLLSIRPAIRFPIGRIIDCAECDFEILTGHESQPYDVLTNREEAAPVRGKQVNYKILIRPSLVAGPYRAELETTVNRAIIDLATIATRLFVLPRARRLAAELGLKVTEWDVRHNKTRLGACSSKGCIILGSRLIFLPPDLRDYVIYHELAHLIEMNHSPRFHALCDRYCSGREKELKAQLRAFSFPVF